MPKETFHISSLKHTISNKLVSKVSAQNRGGGGGGGSYVSYKCVHRVESPLKTDPPQDAQTSMIREDHTTENHS